ncbi:MAG: hypothetical protein WDN49_27085 [Acetobacteraceae bacterium]
MIASSAIGIFLIPMLYVTFQGLRENIKRRTGGKPAVHHEPTAPG